MNDGEEEERNAPQRQNRRRILLVDLRRFLLASYLFHRAGNNPR